MNATLDLQSHSHKRLNILTNEWVLVSPHRMKRPWQGKSEDVKSSERLSHDPSCYLCPGNKRANGEFNPNYKSVFVFENDFGALQLTSNTSDWKEGLLHATAEKGVCKVVCFSPDHSKTLAKLSTSELIHVIDVWQKEFNELAELDDIQYVQIFENKGEIMGCSNPHPHGQIWSQSSIPNEVLKKDRQQSIFYQNTGKSLLLKYINDERRIDDRLVYENEDYVIIVPFWAIWPYETMIVPKQHQTNISELSINQKKGFADAMSVLTQLYDQLFDCDFPYSSGIHQSPTTRHDQSHWHWHMSFYPPLLRSASVKKFMVGYEMFASPQRDLTPEVAAGMLRDLIQ